MSIDYLEELEQSVENGMEYFACPVSNSRWVVTRNKKDLEKQAQRAADTLGGKVNIYRLVGKSEAASGEQYLIVRKIEAPASNGEPRLQWALVGTREAAEMLRDVSQGATPYFGAVLEATFDPASARDGSPS